MIICQVSSASDLHVSSKYFILKSADSEGTCVGGFEERIVSVFLGGANWHRKLNR